MENRTLFDGVHVLPPASAWVFRDGALERKDTYFQSREWEEQSHLEPEAYYKEIKEVFSRNLPRYFCANERIGMSLTGGVDTRMIMAWQKASPGSLPCYTFGGMFRDCQDVLLARQVAGACGQSHEVISVGREFLLRFSHYAERTVYLTDGCVEVGYSPDLYINERVREIAPVRMTGNYGDQILRQFRAFKPAELAPGLLHPEFVSYVRQAGETYTRILQGHPLSFPFSGRHPGIITGFSRWSRLSSPCVLHLWTTTLSERSSGGRSRLLQTMMFVCD